MKIYIDPSCDILYSSFYINGLYEIYGKANVAFSSKYFKSFKHDNHFFAFVVEDRKVLRKVVIDFTDSSHIDSVALDWCDVYGKINLDCTLPTSTKVIAIGPSFGIQIYSLLETLWYAVSNLLKSYHRIPNKRKFLSDYKAQWRRPKFSSYQSAPAQDPYVFFISSLWKQEPETNRFRAHFIRVCRLQKGIRFEGGFAPRTRNDMRGFEDLTAAERIGISEYLKKTSQSLMVFNTPAVKSCHGWKLAEYLCLGKAIISTPLQRALPSPLTHLEQVFYSLGDQETLKQAVNELMTNTALRQQLERGARHYFNTFLSPRQVIQALLDEKASSYIP
ncbi:hypothetical protein OE09_2136 [Flavobacteriaceae bacterium MAR_2010_72]|nr:hypothetical protein OE09_2136 [Flavobacteriaceae bacterium MAR_2010_72]